MGDSPQGQAGQAGSGWWRGWVGAKGVARLLVAMAGLFAALFSIYIVEGGVRGADQTVVRAYNTRSQLVELHSSLLDAETAVSAYLATGDARFAALYEKSRRAVDPA